MKNILVTGGAGYIGSHTCVELIKKGYNVIVIDNYSNSSSEPIKRVEKLLSNEIRFYKCDVRDKEELSKIFSENSIDAVIHFAGLKSVGESCKIPLEYYNNNIYGLIVLCEIMKNFNVKNLVFSSSATVYGDNNPPYKEDMPSGLLTNPYGRTKYFIEQILIDLIKSDKSFNISILRYFNPIGAHESGTIGEDPSGIPNNLMPYILKVAVGVLPELVVFGGDYDTPDGTCIRDYIHVVDLSKGHLCALNKLFSSKGGLEIYNLGTGKGYSVLELINIFQKVSGVKLNYSIGSRRAGDLAICFADSSKARIELGWKPQYNIEKMCEDSWRWQTMNPKGYQNGES